MIAVLATSALVSVYALLIKRFVQRRRCRAVAATLRLTGWLLLLLLPPTLLSLATAILINIIVLKTVAGRCSCTQRSAATLQRQQQRRRIVPEPAARHRGSIECGAGARPPRWGGYDVIAYVRAICGCGCCSRRHQHNRAKPSSYSGRWRQRHWPLWLRTWTWMVRVVLVCGNVITLHGSDDNSRWRVALSVKSMTPISP